MNLLRHQQRGAQTFGGPLNPARNVDGIAENGRLHQLRMPHLTQNDRAEMETDSDLPGLLEMLAEVSVDLLQRLSHLQRGRDGAEASQTLLAFRRHEER